MNCNLICNNHPCLKSLLAITLLKLRLVLSVRSLLSCLQIYTFTFYWTAPPFRRDTNMHWGYIMLKRFQYVALFSLNSREKFNIIKNHAFIIKYFGDKRFNFICLFFIFIYYLFIYIYILYNNINYKLIFLLYSSCSCFTNF